jgi:hypothetical protein
MRAGDYAKASTQASMSASTTPPNPETHVPKSKVRKKTATPLTTKSIAPPPKALAPSPAWYPMVMAGVLLLGLAYLVVYYLTSSGTDPNIPVMGDLGAWNFAVGFGVMLLGLVMAVRWR